MVILGSVSPVSLPPVSIPTSPPVPPLVLSQCRLLAHPPPSLFPTALSAPAPLRFRADTWPRPVSRRPRPVGAPRFRLDGVPTATGGGCFLVVHLYTPPTIHHHLLLTPHSPHSFSESDGSAGTSSRLSWCRPSPTVGCRPLSVLERFAFGVRCRVMSGVDRRVVSIAVGRCPRACCLATSPPPCAAPRACLSPAVRFGCRPSTYSAPVAPLPVASAQPTLHLLSRLGLSFVCCLGTVGPRSASSLQSPIHLLPRFSQRPTCCPGSVYPPSAVSGVSVTRRSDRYGESPPAPGVVGPLSAVPPARTLSASSLCRDSLNLRRRRLPVGLSLSLFAGRVLALSPVGVVVARRWLVGTARCRSVFVARYWSVAGVDCCVSLLMSSSVRWSSLIWLVAASTVLVGRCSAAGVGRRVLHPFDRVLSGGSCRVVLVVDRRVSPVGVCRWCRSSLGCRYCSVRSRPCRSSLVGCRCRLLIVVDVLERLLVAASAVCVDRCSVAGVGRRVLLLLGRVLSGGPCRVVSVVDCRVLPLVV